MNDSTFLDSYNIHDFDVPLTTVDVVCFRYHEDRLQVLLHKRPNLPFREWAALPGGFIDLKKDHDLDQVAKRKVLEKTGVSVSYLEQVETVGSRDRDPRGWAVTVLYLSLLAKTAEASEPASGAYWCDLEKALATELAFDHGRLLDQAFTRLQRKSGYTVLPLFLLSEECTLVEAQRVFECVLTESLEKKSFRRRLTESGVLEETGKMAPGKTRPAKIYRRRSEAATYTFNALMGKPS